MQLILEKETKEVVYGAQAILYTPMEVWLLITETTSAEQFTERF